MLINKCVAAENGYRDGACQRPCCAVKPCGHSVRLDCTCPDGGPRRNLT